MKLNFTFGLNMNFFTPSSCHKSTIQLHSNGIKFQLCSMLYVTFSYIQRDLPETLTFKRRGNLFSAHRFLFLNSTRSKTFSLCLTLMLVNNTLHIVRADAGVFNKYETHPLLAQSDTGINVKQILCFSSKELGLVS